MTNLLDMSMVDQFNVEQLQGSQLACNCGGDHLPEDHSPFLEGMPTDPVDMIDDLLKMGLYSPKSQELAEGLTQAEMMEALFIDNAAGDDPLKRQLCEELMAEAGGLEAAMATAFGPNAAEFFNTTRQRGQFSRRQFMRQVALAAGLLTLGMTASTDDAMGQSRPSGPLEKNKLRIGYIPIACATPIIMSQPLGFYRKYNLEVELVKLPSWAAVRDSAIAGQLDAYHMLGPLPIAMTLGLGSVQFPMRLASIQNINGQAFAVANKHKGKINGPKDFKGLTIGVPFTYSIHNLLVRYYLASGGLNPDRDVKIVTVPPPEGVARMSVGELDSFFLPDNFAQRVVAQKIGFIHIISRELWNGHPCCSFCASQNWITSNPNTFRAVNKAIIDGCGFARQSVNRPRIAKAIAPREFLNNPEPVLNAVLTGNWENGLGQTLRIPRIDFDPYPWHSFSSWIMSQMVRWSLMPAERARYQQISDQVYLTDIARQLARETGQNPPTAETRVEKLKFDTFDPRNPSAYISAQRAKFGR
jgi:nitrate/nitrite transport system substrate-binding protein